MKSCEGAFEWIGYKFAKNHVSVSYHIRWLKAMTIIHIYTTKQKVTTKTGKLMGNILHLRRELWTCELPRRQLQLHIVCCMLHFVCLDQVWKMRWDKWTFWQGKRASKGRVQGFFVQGVERKCTGFKLIPAPLERWHWKEIDQNRSDRIGSDQFLNRMRWDYVSSRLSIAPDITHLYLHV